MQASIALTLLFLMCLFQGEVLYICIYIYTRYRFGHEPTRCCLDRSPSFGRPVARGGFAVVQVLSGGIRDARLDMVAVVLATDRPRSG